jgi:four helix bundle protein
VQRFTELKAWKRGHELALRVYRLTAGFPTEERYGLVSQLRRAAVSIPTNVAEGSKRRGGNDYARFLNVAEGSLVEVEYLLMLSRDLGYVRSAVANPLLESAAEVGKILHGLREAVESAG